MAVKESVYTKGSWQDTLDKSATLTDRSVAARKKASALLWDGAQDAIDEWLDNATDESAEGLYDEVISILGEARKGDASKIKTVALAFAADKIGDLANFPNLFKAYGAAVKATKGAKEEKEQDDAAEKAVESIVAPKTASTVESAAALLLSKGIDGAVVAILDALNGGADENNTSAHRAFLRAVSTEIGARDQAVKDAAKKEAAAALAQKKAEREKVAAEKKAEREKVAAEKKAEREKAKAEKAASEDEGEGSDEPAPKRKAPVKRAAPAKRAAPVKRATPVKRG